MERLDKNSWLLEGIRILECEGFTRITIDNLCDRQKRSKGSFYYHFKNIEGYVESIMKYWQKKNTVDLIKFTEAISSTDIKLKHLNELTSSLSQKTEQIIRAWSFSNDTVKEFVRQVDDMRIKYLIDLNIQSGMMEVEANDYAIIEYGTLIGIQQLCPDISQEYFKHLFLVFLNKVKTS